MTDHKLQIVPLGGLGEFGMNMTAIRYADDIIVVDAGMMFPEAELLGVDLVMPDLTFLKEHQAMVRALVLTHGHEDHIGAVPYFLSEIDVPVYGTAFTLALVDRRLEEYELEEEPRFIKIKPKQMLEIGPFKIEFIHVTHSIVSAVALAITTPLGVIIHTGDFKVDPTPTDNELFDLHTLADYGKRGVLLLLSDSTNSDRPGYTESERAVRPRMEEIFSRSERRIVVSCFSSSIHRIQLVLDLAQEYSRSVAVFGRSMTTVTEIAHGLGLLDIPDGILLRPQDAMDRPPDKVAFLISGTQGEPMSALARVAVDNHKHAAVEAGDTVVLSSRIIPGNEKAIFRMIDHMARRGADVLYGSMNPPLHVSGHASVEEMKLVLNLVRPRYFMPIHGEFRQLSKHARLAEHLKFRGPGRELRDGIGRRPGDRSPRRAQGGAGHRGPRVHRLRLSGRYCGGDGDPRPAPPFGGRNRAADHRHQPPHRAYRSPARNCEPRIRPGGRRLRVSAIGAAGRGQNTGGLQPGGEDGLGSHEGEDPRGPEAVHREGDFAPAADHAGDPGSLKNCGAGPSGPPPGFCPAS